MANNMNESKETAMDLNISKRDFLRLSSVLGLAAVSSFYGINKAIAAEWEAKSFNAKNLADTLKEMGADDYTISSAVEVKAAEIAENGAVVPVRVTSSIANTEYMAILVEKNPNPLVAAFNLADGTEANVKTRIKMGETSNVFAMVKADGKWFAASKEVKVTLGGCGG